MEKTTTKNGKGKITIIIGKLIGGGAERVACNLANYLYDKGYSIDIVTTVDTNDTYEVKKGINVSVLLPNNEKKNRLFNIITRQQRLKEYVERNKDIMCYIAMMPKSSFRMAILRKRTKAKIIISERCDPKHHSFLSRVMMRYAGRKCDGLVVQTKEIGEWYKNTKSKTIIPNAVNEDVVVPRSYPIKNKFVAIGRLETQKNYPMMIKAFSFFHAKYPEYYLEIYGEGALRQKLEKLAIDCGVGDKVRFMGYVKDVPVQIADAKCFLMSSNYEGIPNALIEAMCIGLPCIATDCDGGGVRSLLRNRVNGILIKKGDQDGFVSAMHDIVENDNLREAIETNSKFIRDELDSDKIYAEWVKYINLIVDTSEVGPRGGKYDI